MTAKTKVAPEEHWFALGKKAGREELIAELRELLKLDELIYKAIEDHERSYHE